LSRRFTDGMRTTAYNCFFVSFAAIRLQEDVRRQRCMVCWHSRIRHHPTCVGDWSQHCEWPCAAGGHQRCCQRLCWNRYHIQPVGFGNSCTHDRMVFKINKNNTFYFVNLVERVCVYPRTYIFNWSISTGKLCKTGFHKYVTNLKFCSVLMQIKPPLQYINI